MKKNHQRLSKRSPLGSWTSSIGLLLVAVVLGGCATARPSTEGPRVSEATGGAGEAESPLAPFLACTSPAQFVQMQRGVDMARLVEALEDGDAVRLGALGPVPEQAAGVLNHKRASYLITVSREYEVALAEVFALFVLHTASDVDVRQVLGELARDKRLGQTLGRMPVVREQLRRRGLPLSDFPERPERFWGDGLRGAREGMGGMVAATPLLQVGGGLGYSEQKSQLPLPYQRALDEVESALAKQALAPGHVALGVVDELTFGVPLGFYYLAAGLGQGAAALVQGEYEQAARELTPAVLMVALYAGGKALEARGAAGVHLGEWREVARRLREQLGVEGLREVARYLQADPQAALLVIDGGEAGAVALYEARGEVPKAQAWLSEAKGERPGGGQARGAGGKGLGAVAALVDEAAGLTQEVLEAKCLEVEADVAGPRLSGDVAGMEKQLAVVEKAPPAGATAHPLWSEYLEYGKKRIAELKQGQRAAKGRKLEPPLKWEGYQQMRGVVKRGLAFERAMVELLRRDAALPQAQRRLLGDFNAPRVEAYVGVWKPGSGLRFADALVIEQKPLPGQPLRVETFSFKSRDFSQLKGRPLETRMKADAGEAVKYYGETLDVRRASLRLLFPESSEVPIRRVRLIYDGAKVPSKDTDVVRATMKATEEAVLGVEILFQ